MTDATDAPSARPDDARKNVDEVDSNGPNARPRHDTISQTGGGLPDDTGRPVDLDPAEEAKLEKAIRDLPGGKA